MEKNVFEIREFVNDHGDITSNDVIDMSTMESSLNSLRERDESPQMEDSIEDGVLERLAELKISEAPITEDVIYFSLCSFIVCLTII